MAATAMSAAIRPYSMAVAPFSFLNILRMKDILLLLKIKTDNPDDRSEEHTSELQSLMRTSYAVFCLKKNTNDDIPQVLTTTETTNPRFSITTTTHPRTNPHHTPHTPP